MANIHNMTAKNPADMGAGSAAQPLEKVQAKAAEVAESVSNTVGQAAEKATETTQDLWRNVESYVRANPIPVLIGTAAAGAIVALALSRNSRSGKHRWMSDMARYSDDAQRAVRREMRAIASEERLNKIVNALPAADVSKTVAPFIGQLLESVAAAGSQAREAVSKTVQAVQQGVQNQIK